MDWIAARLRCSSEHAWLVLGEQIKADFQRWQDNTASAATRDGTQLTVGDAAVVVTRKVAFSEADLFSNLSKSAGGFLLRRRTAEAQKVEDFKFIPTLNQKGECSLTLNSEEFEFWQVSRMVLEHVLFA